MTRREYQALCARLEKANRLPAAVREEHRAAYDSLRRRALDYEFAHKLLPLHAIVDDNVRMVVEYLHNEHAALLRAGNAQVYGARAARVLAACMALVAEDADRALAAFGYQEEP